MPPHRSDATYDSFWAHQSASNNNQLAATTQAPGGVFQDTAGEVQADGKNQYLYDGDGRICAVKDSSGAMTGYIYNAEGERVAKGNITAWSCNPSANNFSTTNDYVLGPGGEQVTEMAVSGGTITWKHTNVWADGRLIATYDNTSKGLHFYQDDPLGTRRSQSDPSGTQELACSSLPYGDALSCTGPGSDPTEQHFTGKERDQESGNDYFGARYYASTIGRFLSPDWADKPEAVPYGHLDDPQSLDLYGYVLNNPLRKADLDGHGCPPDCGNLTSSTEDRVLTGLTGAANLYIGLDRGVEAFGELAATPVTLGFSTVPGIYEATQTVAQAGAGATQIAGAITGRTEAANAKADSAIVHTSVSGYVALKVTHGNMDTAAKAAAAEGLVSTSATRSIFKSAATMLDTVLNILTVAKKPPPSPPPPLTPVHQPHN